MVDDSELQAEFDQRLLERLNIAHSRNIDYVTLRTAKNRLHRNWDLAAGNILPKPLKIAEQSASYSKKPYPPSEPLKVRRPRTDYVIGSSDEFLKDTEKVDASTLGRIMRAIGQISRKPDIPQGDTVKPLVDGMKGLWRFRIGDYRLIYEPDSINRRVTVLAFAARSGINE